MPRSVVIAIGSSAASKMAPAIVQLFLLLLVARQGTTTDVGVVALASALAFFCGAIGEFGFGTSLAAPQHDFGAEGAPLRATRRVRVAAASTASGVYALLWLVGLGAHDPRMLLAVPLPFALALTYGYAAALNRSGLLAREGAVTFVETVVVICGAVALSTQVDPAGAALGAVAVVRVAGAVTRARLCGAARSSSASRLPVLRMQLPLVAVNAVVVVQGQIDLLVLGFAGAIALAGLWGPLVRLAYGVLLVAEAASWTLLGRLGDALERAEARGEFGRWRGTAIAIACGAAVTFFVVAPSFIDLAFGSDFVPPDGAILALSLLIPVRTAAFVQSVAIVRAGAHARRLPVLVAAAAILGTGAVVAASADSITVLAAARLASEVVLAAGYTGIARKLVYPGTEPTLVARAS